MSSWQVWALVTGLLVVAEMATGTVYLLCLAAGTAASFVAGYTGAGVAAQLLVGAVIGGGTTAAWHQWRRAHPNVVTPGTELDRGQALQIERWGANGTCRAPYRGSEWDVRYAGEGDPQPGPHVIRAMDGNTLIVHRASPL